jgi:septal ring factor EnvC (AmiA/AmiB activator)
VYVLSVRIAKANQASAQAELSTLIVQENETAAALAAELARLPSETDSVRAEVNAAAAANAATQQQVQDLASALAIAQADLVAQHSESAQLAPKVL